MIPQSVFQNIMANNQLNPVPGYLHQLSTQAKGVLEAKGLSNDEKAALYDQMLQQNMAMRENLLNTPLVIEKSYKKPTPPQPTASPASFPPLPSAPLTVPLVPSLVTPAGKSRIP